VEKFEKVKRFAGVLIPPPDKSITHRALILASMAKGRSIIHNPLMSLDTANTSMLLKDLGVFISSGPNDTINIESKGYDGLTAPFMPLWCGNSGTTARLSTGLLCMQSFKSELKGDKSLSARPMRRVAEPLRLFGANIEGDTLPLKISPSKELHPAELESDILSAQVKSAFILAALQAKGVSKYSETFTTRNHTELMLPLFGADIATDGFTVEVSGGEGLQPAEIEIPGDVSSAAFLVVAALIFEDSYINIREVGLNPTRAVFLDILRSWGADINITKHTDGYEPVGEVTVRHSPIKGGEISGLLSQAAIDELPALAVLGLFSESGVTIRDAKELRVKESDRIRILVDTFMALGAEVEEYKDGLFVAPLEKEPSEVPLHAAGDHRIAMLNILLAKKWGFGMNEDDIKCINISFPNYLKTLEKMEKQ
jgi:3-phosphoshikimate 1-carboxyvinyltransferase